MDDRPVVAFMYDFDKTLCTKNMQEYSFIPDVGMEPEEFWQKVVEMKDKEHMDSTLAYLYMTLKSLKDKGAPSRREDLMKYGDSLELYPGVKEWFSLMNSYCESLGLKAEHFIISSGLKEIIEGCSISKEFKEIYACEFLYDVNGEPIWMKDVVNYTTKTQFVFRINKGVLDISDDERVNSFLPDDERPVPFTNMIYFGDGSTDVPCMKLIKIQGGHSVAVYDGSRRAADELFKAGRVNFICKADYSKDGELYNTITDVLQKIRYNERLKKKSKRIVNNRNI